MQHWTSRHALNALGLLGICVASLALVCSKGVIPTVPLSGRVLSDGRNRVCAPFLTAQSFKRGTSRDTASLPPARFAAATESALPAYAPGAPLRLMPGTRQTYALQVKSVSDADLKPLLQVEPAGANRSAGSKPDAPIVGQTAYHLQSDLRARLLISIVSRRQNSLEAMYTLQEPRLQLVINGSSANALAHPLAQEITHDMSVRLTPQGRILSVRFARDTSQGAQRLLRSLLALTQWVTPPASPRSSSGQGRRAESWNTREEDSFGVFEAHYKMEAAQKQDEGGRIRRKASFVLVRKTTLRYLPDASAPGERSADGEGTRQTTRPGGSERALVDAQTDRPYRIEGDLEQTNRVVNKEVGHTRTMFSLLLTRQEALLGAQANALRQSSARLQNMPAVRLSMRPSRQESELDVQRAELAQASLPELLAQLAQSETITIPEYNDTPLYLKFKALISLHPKACSALENVLAAAPPRSRAMQLLVRALGTVGSPQAQNALLGAALARKQDEDALVSLLPALGMVSSPTVDAEVTMRRFALEPTGDAAHTALLLLGAMAHNLASAQPTRAARLVEWISRQDITPLNSPPVNDPSTAGAAQAREQSKRVLAALGNAGLAQALPLLRRALKQGTPDIRAEAAAALRFIGQSTDGVKPDVRERIAGEQADALLADALTMDKAAEVRAQAVFALSFRKTTPRTFAAQKRALLADSEDSVRQAALNSLWNVRAAFPAVRALVQQVRERDASENMRQAAGSLLETPAGP